jgi:hypothetical protein
VRVDASAVFDLYEGARYRSFSTSQIEYLRGCIGITWAKAFRAGEVSASETFAIAMRETLCDPCASSIEAAATPKPAKRRCSSLPDVPIRPDVPDLEACLRLGVNPNDPGSPRHGARSR